MARSLFIITLCNFHLNHGRIFAIDEHTVSAVQKFKIMKHFINQLPDRHTVTQFAHSENKLICGVPLHIFAHLTHFCGIWRRDAPRIYTVCVFACDCGEMQPHIQTKVMMVVMMMMMELMVMTVHSLSHLAKLKSRVQVCLFCANVCANIAFECGCVCVCAVRVD